MRIKKEKTRQKVISRSSKSMMFTYEKAHVYTLSVSIKYTHARDLITSSEKIFLFFFDLDDVYNFLLLLFHMAHLSAHSMSLKTTNKQKQLPHKKKIK
jgi:hypothetical protein